MGGEGLVLAVLAFIAGVLLVAGLVQAFLPPTPRSLRHRRIRSRTRPDRRGGRPASAAARRPEPASGLRSAHAPAEPVEEGLKPAGHARRGSWADCRSMANALIQQREFESARRLIREALADEELPENQREAFTEFLSATYAREIEELTADAIRTLEDEEAVISLGRAQTLLFSIPDAALTVRHREEVRGRLCWGYTQLGLHRVEAGEFETALEPLIQALKLGSVDSESRKEPRAALVRALDAVFELRSERIGQLLKGGNRESALAESVRLLALVCDGLGVGLSREELTLPLTKARHVVEQLQQG